MLNVGPEMHKRRRGDAAKSEIANKGQKNATTTEAKANNKPQKIARCEKQYHVLPEHLVRVYTDKESSEYEAFLGRSPELKEKLQWHLESLKKSFSADSKRPFLPFCIDESEKGIKQRDLGQLIDANWLWPNFTNPDDPYVSSQQRRSGVYLNDFALECMEYLSGGHFSFQYMCFPQNGANEDVATLEGYANFIISSSKHHSVLPARGGKIYKFTNSVMERFSLKLGVKVSVLERSLFACTNYFYRQGVWFVLVEDCEENYE